MSILVWIEQNQGDVVGSCWEVVGKARQLADELDVTLHAALFGASTEVVATEIRRYGVDVVHTATSEAFAGYRMGAFATALRQAAAAADATIILTSGTIRGRELAAAVAADLDAGLAPDAVDLRVDGGKLVAVRSIYSNNILTDISFHSEIQVASVRPRSFPMPEAGAEGGSVNAVEVTLSAADVAETVLESSTIDGGEISLTDASIIVSGGRGVAADPEKGFALVAELAETLGAAVGASRAAVDAGYIPYKHQVGQTGKTVRPDLYIACGISGAIQHLAGMGGSKVIVAINKDGDAPIFERASYGIVGDLYEVLPALSAEFRKRLG